MDDGTLKLDDVAKAAGVSPRTVRYYIQRGLLPAPAFRGPDTAYGPEHVLRLRAIKQLQAAYWPLDAIAGLLAGKSERALRELAEGRDVPSPRVLERSDDRGEAPPPSPSAPVTPPVARVRRVTLAEGVVLEVDDDAPPDARALAERLLAQFARPERRRP
jgi:Ca-activated chloride channel family protein